MPGFLFVFILAIETVFLIASYLLPQFNGLKKYNHYHTTVYIILKLLPSALYSHLNSKFEDFLAFLEEIFREQSA